MKKRKLPPSLFSTTKKAREGQGKMSRDLLPKDAFPDDPKKEAIKWLRATQNTATARTYSSAQLRWVNQCRTWNKAACPAEPATVCTYIRSLVESGGYAAGTIRGAISAIGDLHRYEEEQPTQAAVVKETLARATMLTAQTNRRKGKTLTVSMLRQMGQGVKEGSPKEVRDYTIMLLSFMAFLRGSESTNLKHEDVRQDRLDGQDVLVINVEKSKTDQAMEGAVILLAACPGDKILCPVHWAKKWGAMRKKGTYYFNRLDKAQRDRSINGGKLSTETVSHILKEKIEGIGGDAAGWASHALRRGGATAAAAAGVLARLIQSHGRWKSNAYKVYIAESLGNLLSVSSSIMLFAGR